MGQEGKTHYMLHLYMIGGVTNSEMVYLQRINSFIEIHPREFKSHAESCDRENTVDEMEADNKGRLLHPFGTAWQLLEIKPFVNDVRL